MFVGDMGHLLLLILHACLCSLTCGRLLQTFIQMFINTVFEILRLANGYGFELQIVISSFIGPR